MEGNKSKSHALLVFGAPCSGKTTFATRFADKFGLAFYDMEEIQKDNNLSREVLLNIIKLILRTGKSVVLEGGMSNEASRREIRNICRRAGYEPSLIWVQTDMASIRSRMKSRYQSVAKAKTVYDEAISTMEAPSEAERPIILSGKHTFETQTKHALAGLADVDKR